MKFLVWVVLLMLGAGVSTAHEKETVRFIPSNDALFEGKSDIELTIDGDFSNFLGALVEPGDIYAKPSRLPEGAFDGCWEEGGKVKKVKMKLQRNFSYLGKTCRFPKLKISFQENSPGDNEVYYLNLPCEANFQDERVSSDFETAQKETLYEYVLQKVFSLMGFPVLAVRKVQVSFYVAHDKIKDSKGLEVLDKKSRLGKVKLTGFIVENADAVVDRHGGELLKQDSVAFGTSSAELLAALQQEFLVGWDVVAMFSGFVYVRLVNAFFLSREQRDGFFLLYDFSHSIWMTGSKLQIETEKVLAKHQSYPSTCPTVKALISKRPTPQAISIETGVLKSKNFDEGFLEMFDEFYSQLMSFHASHCR